MVAVVVDHLESIAQVSDFKTPTGTAEALERVLNGLKTHARLGGERDGCKRVGDIVFAWNAEGHITHFFAMVIDFEIGLIGAHRRDVGREVHAAIPAVADGFGVLTADFTGDGVLRAVDAVTGRLAEKLAEDRLDGLNVGVEIEMLGLDVQHDRVLGVEVHERAIALITLDHKEVTSGVPVCIGTEDGNLSADVVRGLLAALTEDVGGECGSGRLSVCASDDDTFFIGHDGG